MFYKDRSKSSKWKRNHDWKATWTPKLLNRNRTVFHLVTSKWLATSPHESQSSAVIRYKFASPLTSLAIAGVTLVPGDSEYNMERSSCFRTWAKAHHVISQPCKFWTKYSRCDSNVERGRYAAYLWHNAYFIYIQVGTKDTVMFHYRKTEAINVKLKRWKIKIELPIRWLSNWVCCDWYWMQS